MKTPYLFDEFFASDLEESVSPFLTPTSRSWGKNISIKSAALAALLLMLAFTLSFFNPSASNILLCLIYFLVGIPSLISAMHDLKNLEINIDVLMTTAAFVAIVMGSGLEGALLLVLFSLSHAMEEGVSKKARSALHHLNHIAPKFASLIDSEGTLFEKAIKEISINETIIVKNGEIIPLDGIIIKGSSSLNLVHLTGESLPIPKTVGDMVPAGARNLESALFISVTRTSSESTLSKLIDLIARAQESKPRLQTILDRFGKHYATTIIALTFLFALTLPFFFSLPYLGNEGSVYRALAFLIAASPCALIIATPTAYLSALSACAKKGILLKGGVTLDALSSCSLIAFDKTGTLTTGELACLDIQSFLPTPLSQETILSIAYGLEQHVVHPIATAISKLASEKQISPANISSFKTIPGSGLEGVFENTQVFIGEPEYILTKLPLAKQNECRKWMATFKKNNQILSILLIGTHLFAFRFKDQIRTGISDLIDRLKQKNKLQPIMLTGDHHESAQEIGKQLGIQEIFANLRPEHKLAKVEELSLLGSLAMVGDGMNDAPSLARATVGISMGKIGSATAIDASDVVLLNDDIHHLSWLFSKSQNTKRIVKQNLTLALSVICFVTLPALLGLVPLWAAVLLHEGGTVLVGLNSLRLIR